MTKVVILAGGLGTRLKEETVYRPKPMVEIGGKPILWHIMKIYAHYGFTDFVVALGYKGEMIKEWFLNYYYLNSDITVKLSKNEVKVHDASLEEDWSITLADTGADTQTGGRIKRLKKYLDGETFMATYGDGVSNVDVGKLLKFHRSHGKAATVTAVRPPSRFGELGISDSHVHSFKEKPLVSSGFINGGFFAFEPALFDYIESDSTHLEDEPMAALTSKGELMAFVHDAYWRCMDTYRDMDVLNKEWQEGKAGWKVWK